MPIIPSGKELIDPYFVLEQSGVKEGMAVADLGCGTLGHYVFPAAKTVGVEGQVYAVDIQKGVINSIEGRSRFESVHNVEAIWGDIERKNGIKIADGACDVVLIINNLYLAKDKANLFNEAKRILKKNGRLCVIDWIVSGIAFGPPAEQRVSKKDAKDIVAKQGFVFTTDFKPGEFHYGLVFKK